MAGIFDKIVAGVNKSATTVGANSKALVEKAKVNTTINSLENERNQFFHNLGKQVFSLYQNNDEVMVDENVLALVEKIGKHNEFIAKQQEQLILIDEEAKRTIENALVATQNQSSSHMVSPDKISIKCACGYDNSPEVKFCAECGSRVEIAHGAITPTSNTVKCACGFDNAVGAAFCGDCGSKI